MSARDGAGSPCRARPSRTKASIGLAAAADVGGSGRDGPKGPVLAKPGPSGNPAAERLHLRGREPRSLRRHLQVGVGGHDALEQGAGCLVAGHDRSCAAVEFAGCGRRVVESQAAFLRVGPVAGEAPLGQERLDLPREIDRLRAGAAGRSHGEAEGCDGHANARPRRNAPCRRDVRRSHGGHRVHDATVAIDRPPPLATDSKTHLQTVKSARSIRG